MNYNPSTSLTEPRAKDKQFANFFTTVKGILKNTQGKVTNLEMKFNDKDHELNNLFIDKQSLIHHHLANNFDTPNAIHQLAQLVSSSSIYMGVENTSIKPTLVRQIAKYVHHILFVLGFIRETDSGEFDYDIESAASDSSIDPVMDVLMNFRNQI